MSNYLIYLIRKAGSGPSPVVWSANFLPFRIVHIVCGAARLGIRDCRMGRNPQGWRLWTSALCLGAVASLALAVDVHAQQLRRMPGGRVLQVKPTESANEDNAENVFVPADRETLRKLSDAKSLLAEGRFGEAVRNLGALLDGAEDYFFQPDKQSPMHRSLKAESQRLIGGLPREGRELYELQYGARARQLLDEALKAADATRMAEVSRRFFHTKAGRQATFLLGMDHFSHGRALASALLLQRLCEGGSVEEFEPTLSLTLATAWLQTNMPKKASEALQSLRQRSPDVHLEIGGRQVAFWSQGAEPVRWLVDLIGQPTAEGPSETDEWLMFRGDPARNTSVAGGAPLMNLRWHVSASEDPTTETALEQQQKEYAEQGIVKLPALHPLAVGDVLLMRTLVNLLAVDLKTGKRLWEVPVDDPVDVNPSDPEVQQSSRVVIAAQRAWGDLTFGTLSSDGRYVFSIEDLKTEASSYTFRNFGGRRIVLNPALNMSGDQNGMTNRLAAHDIRTGKLKWHLGGPAGQHALRLAETFFLGPPLPLLGHLYVLGETKNEIRLMALDAATGDLIWSQQLALAEQSVAQDSLRRCAGVSPSYSEGMLICPTGNGAIVAVELATRSLLWGYCYSQDRGLRRANGFSSAGIHDNEPRWGDGSVTIAEGRVLITPIESEWLYCLSLTDGSLLWKVPRADACYLACVDGNRVVLAGKRNVRALNMADGKPAWGGRPVALPANAGPSGRGFVSDGRYYLPLTTAEVAEIDLANGRMIGTAKSRVGNVPGNLICHGGLIVSQVAHGVDTYFQIDVVRKSVEQRLAANPNDAEALSLRGEVLLDAGQRAEAIAAFRRAYATVPEQRTRELLREALLEGLKSDFAAYRGQLAEVEGLVDDPAQKAALLRVMIDGLRRSGDLWTAFETTEKLIDLEAGTPPYDQVDKNVSVRRDRWVQGRLLDLRRAADGELAERMDRAVERRVELARKAKGIDALRQSLGYFGSLAVSAAVREELVTRMRSEGKLLEAELWTKDPPKATAAVDDKPWPTGKVEATVVATRTTRPNAYGRSAVEFRGPTAPFFRDLSLQFDNSRRTLVAYDGWGQERWQLSLSEGAQHENFYSAGAPRAEVEGHLLLLFQGTKLVAVDTTAASGKAGPRVVWSQDVANSKAGSVRVLGVGAPRVLPALPWRVQAQLGVMGQQLAAVTRRYVCFQRFHNLVAVDPANGETLWMRQDLPPNCMLFGDEQFLVVLPPDRDEAMLLRAVDGELLGTRRIPRIARRPVRTENNSLFFSRLDDSCLSSIGHKLLLWWPEGNRRTLTLIDPLEQRDAWNESRSFAGKARACVLGNEAVGVLEPDGRFVLIGLHDGRTIADVQLQPEPNLQEIFLLSSQGQYFLVTRRSPLVARTIRQQPIPGCSVEQIEQGRVYALDANGKLQWPAPVELKDQGLLLNQPSRLPVLTFINQSYVQKPNGEGRSSVSLLCVDKRSGRTLYGGTFGNPTSLFQVTGAEKTNTVNLIMQQKTVTLKFTQEPISAAATAGERPSAKPVEKKPSLWESLQKALRGTSQTEKEDEEEP